MRPREFILAAILIIAISPNAASDNVLEGERTIDCDIYAIQYIDCSPNPCCTLSNDFNVTVGSMQSVTLTISWTPQSEYATRFKARIVGNDDCMEEQPFTSCDDIRVDGVSPLVLTLNGVAASNTTVFAGVSLDDNCDQLEETADSAEDFAFGLIESCQESPFFQAAFNQTYHYEWTLVPN